MAAKSWSDISVADFKEIQSSYNDPELTDEDRALGLVAIVTGEDPLKMPFKEFKTALDGLSFLSEEVKPSEVRGIYSLNGTQYRLKRNLAEMTTAQYIDYTSYIRSGSQSDELNYEDVLSVFLIPEGHEGYNDGYDLQKVKADIRNFMPITDAIGIYRFFFLYFKHFTERSLSSLNRRIRKMRRKERDSAKREKMERLQELLKTLSRGASRRLSSRYARRP